jgi:hypothetical protein
MPPRDPKDPPRSLTPAQIELRAQIKRLLEDARLAGVLKWRSPPEPKE